MEVLVVYQKWEDAAEYLYHLFTNLPKSERYTMGASMRDSLFSCGSHISRANKIKNLKLRREEIERADKDLADLKVMIRLAYRMKFISTKKYEVSAAKLTELGKMLGGWLRSCSTQG